MTVALCIVEAVAHDEFVGDIKTDVLDVNMDLCGFRLAKCCSDFDRCCAATQ